MQWSVQSWQRAHTHNKDESAENREAYSCQKEQTWECVHVKEHVVHPAHHNGQHTGKRTSIIPGSLLNFKVWTRRQKRATLRTT
eukprot:957989-Pelagomonas_calceolata.AAC.1